MCGAYTLATTPDRIQSRFGLYKAPAKPRPLDIVRQGTLA